MSNVSKLVALVSVIILVLSASSSTAQEWSDEQKAVWNHVEAYWELGIQEDLEGVMNYIHPDYSGWDNSRALPGNKASFEKWIKYYFENFTWIVFEINLTAMTISDDIAIVHYYYSGIIADADGKKNQAKGRWTDILKKQGDKWLLIGDHGGATAKN